MRSYWQSPRLGWTIVATMFAVAIVEWSLAPVSIPTHWNGEGSIDRHGGKVQGLLLVPLSAAFAWGLITALAPFQQGRSVPAMSRVLIHLGYPILLIFITDSAIWCCGSMVSC